MHTAIRYKVHLEDITPVAPVHIRIHIMDLDMSADPRLLLEQVGAGAGTADIGTTGSITGHSTARAVHDPYAAPIARVSGGVYACIGEDAVMV
jgi:hypothetical protein